AKEAAVSSGRPERDPASSKSVKSWLGRLDSNQGMPESKSGALPLGYAPLINDLRALRPWLLPNLLPKRPNRSACLRGARAYSRSKHAVEFGSCLLLHSGRHMAIEVECGRNGRMAKSFLSYLWMDAGQEQLRRVAVPKIVEPDPR